MKSAITVSEYVVVKIMLEVPRGNNSESQVVNMADCSVAREAF